MGRAEGGGDGRLDVLLGDAHRFFASSSPVGSGGATGWASKKTTWPGVWREPLYLLLSGFQKLFWLSTVAIFCCSSKSPSGLGIEYLGDLYGWKILYYIRITLPSYNLQVTDDSGLRRCTFFISTTAFLSKHSRWYDISKLSDPDQTLRQQILRTQYRFCSESYECVTCQLVTQVT